MNEIKNNGGPAFPLSGYLVKSMIDGIEASHLDIKKKAEIIEQIGESSAGITMRDYFAAQALTGAQIWDAVLNGKDSRFAQGEGVGELAEVAYAVADAMLKARLA